MRNSGLEETQAGIKIARRNVNNFRYAEDTSLMAESGEEPKSFQMKKKKKKKVKEVSENVGLKLRSWHPVSSLHGTKMWKQCQTFCFGDPKLLQMVIVAMKLKDTYFLEGKL